jgi:hypothetical protein
MMEIQFCIIETTCIEIWMTSTINGGKLPWGINGEASNGGDRKGKPLETLT